MSSPPHFHVCCGNIHISEDMEISKVSVEGCIDNEAEIWLLWSPKGNQEPGVCHSVFDPGGRPTKWI